MQGSIEYKRVPALPETGVASSHFPTFAWGVLVYNVAVILWGALVRATGSGAGCGGHWPLCNGQVLPEINQAKTQVEFIHRVMSGVALIAVIALFTWAWRAFPKEHPARRWANWSMLFIVTEALLGAALVLFGYVSQDQSAGRVISLSLHLVNTFALLASLTLTARWSSVVEAPKTEANKSWKLWFAIALVILTAIAGAITALGDTLFPAATVADDFAAGASLLIRLRVIHPALSLAAAAYLVVLVMPGLRTGLAPRMRMISLALLGIVGTQIAAGLLTLVLRAPLAMQMVHLLVADALWVTLILYASEWRHGGAC